MQCPVDGSHGEFTKEELGAHIANVHPDLTQAQILPIPTSGETTPVDENVITKTVQNLDKIDASTLNPVINPASLGISLTPPPPTVDKPQPIVLKYIYEGNCPKCKGQVKTLVLEVGKPKETHAIAFCDTDGQLEERTVAKL
jgi:hypothetical protein